LEEPKRSDILGVDAGGKSGQHLAPLGWDDELIAVMVLVHSIQ
jgi:hypothetical protein